MKILLIIPAYNEEENILKVCKNIDEYNLNNSDKKLDYIVINDASKDNTSKILKDNNIPHIDLVANLGIGGAVQTGYKYAYDNGYDIAVQFDGDGQHDVNYVYTICEPIINKKVDICIGSRYLDKTTSSFKSTFMRRLGKNIISVIIRMCCRVKITDPTSGFRATNNEVIKIFASDYPTDYPEPESLVNLIKHGFRVTEKAVSMNERTAGKSFATPLKSAHYMIKVSIAICIDSMRKTTKREGDV